MMNKNSKRNEWKEMNFNSKLYESIRLKAIKFLSLNTKNWMRLHKEKISGKNNGSYNTMWITNPLTNENKKIKKGDLIPNGWVKGRYVSLEFCEKVKLAYKPEKRMWIRKKDFSEQKLVEVNFQIPEGWEKGFNLKAFGKTKKR